MTWVELGGLGEFLGAMGVIVTLVYLSIQVRQNTRAMDDGRRLALAQTYQMRADGLQSMLVQAADSQHIAPIIERLTGLGYPEDVAALEQLSSDERSRFRLWQIAQQTHWDNMLYQYQQGFLDPEYYEDAFKVRVRRLAPTWDALGLIGGRSSFDRALREIMCEESPAPTSSG